jgi:hypothetical protein
MHREHSLSTNLMSAMLTCITIFILEVRFEFSRSQIKFRISLIKSKAKVWDNSEIFMLESECDNLL